MELKNAVVLITGANRGLGLEFAQQALARGARKVYAAARNPASVTLKGVIPVRLDVTDVKQVEEAARACSDVTVVVNNAGIAAVGDVLDDELVRRHFETNVFGVLNLSRAFAPLLAKNGGGAFLNVHSVVSWLATPALGAYAASKAAVWGLTNNLRVALTEQKTQVVGLHMGYVDTDMTQGFDVPKTTPEAVVTRAYDGLEAGASEVLADGVTEAVKQGLSAPEGVYLKAL